MTSLSSKRRLAVCSWSLQPKSSDDLVKRLREIDLKNVQLHLNPIIEDESGWRHTFTRLADAGVEVLSGMLTMRGEDYTTLESIRRTGGLVPDQHWEANRETLRAGAACAAEHGLPRVSLHAGFIPHQESASDFETIRNRVRLAAEIFDQAGVDLLLETGQETAADLLDFIAAVDHPRLGVNFDPANMLLYGMGDPIAALKQLAPHVQQVHIKDARPSDTPGEWGEEVPVGTGAIRWPVFVNTLLEIGFEGDLPIEREAGTNRAADIRAARDLVYELLYD